MASDLPVVVMDPVNVDMDSTLIRIMIRTSMAMQLSCGGYLQHPSYLLLSAFIGVHRRPISGFDFRVRPDEKHIWPPMDADERR
jgi:hypothetical protein